MMKLIALFVLIGLANGRVMDIFQEWNEFKTTYNRVYADQKEESLRYMIFRSNLKKIQTLNEQYPGTKFAVNKFADLSQQEFKAKYLSSTPVVRDPEWPTAPQYSTEELKDLPDTWDWRDKGAVTGVKDQGQCGSCWAFSTTGNIEGQWFLAGNALTSLSEQNLVDCDHECIIFENQTACDAGCDGGLQPNAYNYVIKNSGIDTEKVYPYVAEDQTCQFNPSAIGAKVKNWTMISQDETQMAQYLVNHGPMAIAADAETWQFYFGGVLYIPCGTELDHGILIVGYGTETDIFFEQMPFWIIKNSWGEDWGENGYIRVERGVGRCGVNLYVSSSMV